MPIAPLTPGRIFLTLVACTLGPGCFLADWSASHVFNPRWPPHAKFHNGQTMAMGAALSLATLYYTWRGYGHGRGRGRDDLPDLQEDATARLDLELQRESIKTATLFGSLYWVTAMAAWFFPGALAVDPEFGTGFPQFPLFSGMLGLAWIGGWLEIRRLSRLSKATQTQTHKGNRS
ncbi:hypothetical protein LTR99_007936 [Exophiala xenobiotica]|uniref:Acetyltransferase n=1 Tax=Vermiconidia calcicola TaxID=1690605 RepID=A0AAV9Q6B7_9PEZI|nr:hypothetical protein LTR92_003506 [Exophiala xenobiotica]KAK5535094.1 hypothetical protein LTR25_006102 [Vermiconidia calcicola]KAK5535552.1 hypothetical protein LTR23_008290 [Chaetothyriales sp. CCFEE 6169]KAK5298247.1 hypothetical protein LTR99_007936 [Exophiala xenobiotica]KAK5429177.1 hypothetical protein LTR34_007636 [Exophiala xenobiotica]